MLLCSAVTVSKEFLFLLWQWSWLIYKKMHQTLCPLGLGSMVLYYIAVVLYKITLYRYGHIRYEISGQVIYSWEKFVVICSSVSQKMQNLYNCID